jgi:hypothetical protein
MHRARRSRLGLLLVLGYLLTGGGRPSLAAAACGDLNCDGQLTIADAVRLQRAIFVPNPADCCGLGSASCGDVNPTIPGLGVDDVVVLQAFLNNKPTLFPLCAGEGPTPCSANAGSGPGGESWTTRATRSGTIMANEHWIAGCRVDIDGLVFVASGVTITIDPGALVVGKNPPTSGNGGLTGVSALVFLRGSKINAVGTPGSPILMTSSSHVDSNNGGIGDWGGLTINGAAPVNCPGGCVDHIGDPSDPMGHPFGGTQAGDSSGQVEYLRVEFAGRELTPDNALNVITLNGVGSGTIWDHTQANVGFADCHAWFGGTVSAKFLVSSACGNALMDTQLGATGKFQHYLGVFYNPISGLANGANEGFEWDNNASGFNLHPRNAPRICNATMIGTAFQTNVIGVTKEHGTNLEKGTAGIISDAIIEGFRNAGLGVADNATAVEACTEGLSPVCVGSKCSVGAREGQACQTDADCPPGLVVEHTLLFDNGNDSGGPLQVTGNWTSPCTPAGWYADLTAVDPANPGTNGTNPLTPIVYGTGVPTAQTDLNQFIPQGGSPGVATEPKVNSLSMDCKTLDPFFDTTNYVGAFRPGDIAGNWLTAPWISFRLH